MEHLKNATRKLHEFIDWVQWNNEGRKDQIQYLSDRYKATKNKRIQEGLKKEITKLENENPWQK